MYCTREHSHHQNNNFQGKSPLFELKRHTALYLYFLMSFFQPFNFYLHTIHPCMSVCCHGLLCTSGHLLTCLTLLSWWQLTRHGRGAHFDKTHHNIVSLFVSVYHKVLFKSYGGATQHTVEQSRTPGAGFLLFHVFKAIFNEVSLFVEHKGLDFYYFMFLK